MKKILHTLLIAAPLLAASSLVNASGHGEQDSAPPFNAKELRQVLAEMPRGDIRRGKEAHNTLFCATCHGAQGSAPSRNYPHLAGQRAEYTYKMLLDYHERRRDEGGGRALIMVKLAQLLSAQQMADLASYYASLPLPLGNGEQVDAPVLVRKGDVTRLLTPCASCHGVNGEGGKNETPALAGQVRDYLIRTMHTFKSGRRVNDSEEGMGQFAHDLTAQEIERLADYYASLPQPD